MANTLNYPVTLKNGDDSNYPDEEFELIVLNRDYNAEKSLIVEAINRLELAGYDPKLEVEDFTFNCLIAGDNIDDLSYPNRGKYVDNVLGYRRELEKIMAKKSWDLLAGRSTIVEPTGLDTSAGYDEFDEHKGIVTNINTTMTSDQRVECTITFTKLVFEIQTEN